MKKSLPVLGVLSLLMPGVFAAPVDLSPPPNTLGAADSYGYLQLIREIGTLKFSDNFNLPVRAILASNRQMASPYLGEYWWFPLLESSAYLKREKMMVALLPCGKTMYLRRSVKNTDEFATLDQVWHGKSDGDNFTVSRADGWQIIYSKGHISKLRTDKGDVISWVYSNGLVSSIQENGKEIMSIEMGNAGASKIYLNGNEYDLNFEKVPVLASDNGMAVISGFKPMLSSIVNPDKTTEKYTFEVDSNLIPKITIASGTSNIGEFSWDAISKHILSDGSWNYTIKPNGGKFEPPTISRSDKLGHKEFVFDDITKGVIDRDTLDDGHTITTFFSGPGPLYGKTRRVMNIEGATQQLVAQYTYDNNGKLASSIDSQGWMTRYRYDKGFYKSKDIIDVRPPEIIAKMQKREKQLIDKVKECEAKESNPYDALQDLCFFYLFEMRQSSAAIKAAVVYSAPKALLYTIKLQSINHDETLNSDQKISQYNQLLKEFPDEEKHLSFLISKESDKKQKLIQ